MRTTVRGIAKVGSGLLHLSRTEGRLRLIVKLEKTAKFCIVEKSGLLAYWHFRRFYTASILLAPVVQWQNSSLPSYLRQFDSDQALIFSTNSHLSKAPLSHTRVALLLTKTEILPKIIR